MCIINSKIYKRNRDDDDTVVFTLGREELGAALALQDNKLCCTMLVRGRPVATADCDPVR